MSKPPKFEAIGWSLARAEQGMTIVPDCMNCKHYESEWRSHTTYCRKYDDPSPSLCKDWDPQKGVKQDAAYSRMAYLQLKKKVQQ